MALIQFRCLATGPFLMFEETAKDIFKILDERFIERGAWAPEFLPGLLEKLEAAKARDKAEAAARREALEKALRGCSYDEAGRQKEEALKEAKAADDARVNLYQRVVPLEDMMRRAIKHGKGIMWEPL